MVSKRLRKLVGLMVVGLAFVASSADAQRPPEKKEVPPLKVSWHILEVSYLYANFDEGSGSSGSGTSGTSGRGTTPSPSSGGIDGDGHGLTLETQFQVKGPVHFAAEYNWFDLGDSTDATRAFVGGGLHFSVLDCLDIFGEAGLAHQNVDVDSKLESDSWGVRGGARAMASDKVEVGARVEYFDADGPFEESIGGRASVRYYLFGGLAAGVNVYYDDNDLLLVNAGFRLDFERL